MRRMFKDLLYLKNMSRNLDSDDVAESLHFHHLDVDKKNSNESDELKKYYHDVHGLIRNISNLLQIIKCELNGNNSNIIKYIDSALISASVLNDWNNVFANFEALDEDPFCELQDIIGRLKVMLLSHIIERNCDIEFDPRIPKIAITASDCLRIFKNLMENSMKHAVADKLIIKIAFDDINSRFIELLFSDNGKALSEKVRTKICSCLHGRKCGNLGLSIVSGILKRYEGRVELMPSKCGCVYKVVLPRK